MKTNLSYIMTSACLMGSVLLLCLSLAQYRLKDAREVWEQKYLLHQCAMEARGDGTGPLTDDQARLVEGECKR